MDVKELEVKLTTLENDNKKLDERAKKFEGLLVDAQKQLESFKGVDLEALKAAKEENEILRRQKDGIDEEKFNQTVEGKIQKQREDWQKEKSTLEEKLNVLSAQSNKLKIASHTASALKQIKEDMQPLANSLIEKHVRIEDEKLVIVDENGEKLTSKKKLDEPMAWDEYVETLRDKHPSMFIPTTPGTNRTDGTRKPGGDHGDNGALVSKLQNPEQAKSLTDEDKRKAGAILANKFRRI